MRSLDAFRRQAERWGLELEEATLEGLVSYARLLAGYREANVIGTRDYDRVLLDHVLDSLSCYLYRPLKDAAAVVDIGSGGGLPGIPIAIHRPDTRVTLIEATGKKARFLRQTVEALGLENVTTLDARAEEVGRMRDHRESYDAATARALARLAAVAEYGVPLLRVGGALISMKGHLRAGELAEGERAAGILGAEAGPLIQVPTLPEVGEKERNLVVLSKVGSTPNVYPRRVGVPAKRPLGVV